MARRHPSSAVEIVDEDGFVQNPAHSVTAGIPSSRAAPVQGAPGMIPVEVASFSATARISSVDSSATTGQLLAANSGRKGVIIVNTDANSLYLKYGETATTASKGFTVIIQTNGTWEMPSPIYTGRIDGIWSANGSGYAEITET